MNIIVFLKMVPDVVEELKIADDGISLDEDWLRFKLNDAEEQALEEAAILKEKYGGTITAIALDTADIDESLFLALAKGADSAVKIIGDWTDFRSPAIAQVFAEYLFRKSLVSGAPGETIILCGSQSIDDIEGELAYYLGDILNLPVDGVITNISYHPEQKRITYIKEFSAGIRGEFEMTLPCIMGIQASENPPRYIPIAKIRAIMKSTKLEEFEVVTQESRINLPIERMFGPAVSERAEMIAGTPEDIAWGIVNIWTEKAIL